MSIAVLKRLFESHFREPAERVVALQGELGGSGRQIIRLTATRATAIGILYNVREENLAFLEFSRHFRRHGLPVPEIYGDSLDEGAYLEEDFGDTTLFEFLSKHRNATVISPPVVDVYRKSSKPFQNSKSKPAAISTIPSVILAPASIANPSSGISTISNTISSASPAFPSTSNLSKTISSASPIFFSAPTAIFSSTATFNLATSCFATANLISSIIRAAAKALCNTISPRFSSTQKPISRPNFASNFSITISIPSPKAQTSIAKLFSNTITPTSTFASSRPLALTVSAAFTNAALISSKAFPSLSKISAGFCTTQTSPSLCPLSWPRSKACSAPKNCRPSPRKPITSSSASIVFRFIANCPKTKAATAAASSSTVAAFPIPAAKKNSRNSPAKTRPSSNT